LLKAHFDIVWKLQTNSPNQHEAVIFEHQFLPDRKQHPQRLGLTDLEMRPLLQRSKSGG
jgi:hypothetical protein